LTEVAWFLGLSRIKLVPVGYCYCQQIDQAILMRGFWLSYMCAMPHSRIQGGCLSLCVFKLVCHVQFWVHVLDNGVLMISVQLSMRRCEKKFSGLR